jgi:hypothetical protein
MHVNTPSARFPGRFKVPWLVATLLLSLNMSVAQETSQSAPPQQAPSGGVRIDPSAGPLTPGVPQSSTPASTPAAQAPLPDAPQPVPAQPSAPAQQSIAQEPLGTAAAEQIKTAGGGASRPAGNAIAPAKQHQYRSMLIKLGAVAAAGIAVGTVYGLSRATSSTPPHSAGAVAK